MIHSASTRKFRTYEVYEFHPREIILMSMYAYAIIFHYIAAKITYRISEEELAAYEKRNPKGEKVEEDGHGHH